MSHAAIGFAVKRELLKTDLIEAKIDNGETVALCVAISDSFINSKFNRIFKTKNSHSQKGAENEIQR